MSSSIQQCIQLAAARLELACRPTSGQIMEHLRVYGPLTSSELHRLGVTDTTREANRQLRQLQEKGLVLADTPQRGTYSLHVERFNRLQTIARHLSDLTTAMP